MECVAYLVGLAPSHAKRRRIRYLIGNVVLGPRPRWERFVGELWQLLWLCAVGGDHVNDHPSWANPRVARCGRRRCQILCRSQSGGNGKRKMLWVWTRLLLNSSHPPWRVFALEVTIFFVCPDSWALCVQLRISREASQVGAGSSFSASWCF